jgi:hypothetical protein
MPTKTTKPKWLKEAEAREIKRQEKEARQPQLDKADAERAKKLAALRAAGGIPRDAKGRVLRGHSTNP